MKTKKKKVEMALRSRKGEVKPITVKEVSIAPTIIKQQKEKNNEILGTVKREFDETREKIKKKTEEGSNFALQIVLLVWFLIIAGIFYHVWRTIQTGHSRGSSAAQSNFR